MDDRSEAKSMTLYRPTIVAILYLLNIVLGFSVFVGLVLAYVWRSERDTQEWEKTHYTYLIRTFWIGFVVCLAMFALFFGTIFGPAAFAEPGSNYPPSETFLAAMFSGVFVGIIAAIWFCARTVLSMVKAGNQEPMPRPETWLF
ncbi:DUF4870 family protein [Pontixanthobacter aquaemixtae]|nr:hypothetical protein [Pontixanthobacter aquaemixtae]